MSRMCVGWVLIAGVLCGSVAKDVAPGGFVISK